MRSRAVVLTALTVLLLVAALPAAAPAAPSVSVGKNISIPSEGGHLIVSGKGWPKRVRVQLLIGPPRSEADLVDTVRTDRRGRFQAVLLVSRPPGPAVLLACRRECRDKAAASFRVFAVSFTG